MINWNAAADTLACLDAVVPQLREVAGAVLTVVDNGSTDGSIAAVTSRYPSARFIPLGTNRGFTGGILAGVATSQARNVVFLNNDAVPEPGWLAALQQALDRAPADVASVGGRIVSIDGRLIDFIGGSMTFDGHAFQNGFRMPLGSRPEPRAGDEILFACGGNMIARRERFLELGGFDDDYFAYLEDVDFGWRSWIAGSRALFEPGATVRHHSSATSSRLGDFERGVLFERNAMQTALKNFEDVRQNASAVFLTYLHRLHHYATTRNPNATELTREMGTRPPSPAKDGLRSRVRRRLRGTAPLAAIDDPLTTMQFRAFDWILRHQDEICRKRARIQAMRRRSDGEIFERFPLSVIPTYPGDELLMSGPLFSLLRPDLPSVEAGLDETIAR